MTPKDEPIRHRIIKPESGYYQPKSFGRAYINGNIVEGAPEVTADNWNGGVQPEGATDLSLLKQETPFKLNNVQLLSAQEAYEFVLDNVGATLPKRDDVDKRVIKQVRTGEIKYKDGLENTIGKEFIIDVCLPTLIRKESLQVLSK